MREFKSPTLRNRVAKWNRQNQLLPFPATQTFRGFDIFLKRAKPPLIWIDNEHDDGEWTHQNLRAAVCNADGTDTMVMIRVKRGDSTDVRTYLDFGADGIMFPQLSTAGEVEAAVSLTKYKTDTYKNGQRGFGGVMANHYDESDREYPDRANSSLFNVVQIETAEALENVVEIAAVPGIDMLFIGPGDLSMQLGTPGEPTSDVMMEAMQHIIAAASARLLPVATTPIFGGTPEGFQRLRELGFSAGVYAGDMGLVIAGCQMPEQITG